MLVIIVQLPLIQIKRIVIIMELEMFVKRPHVRIKAVIQMEMGYVITKIIVILPQIQIKQIVITTE